MRRSDEARTRDREAYRPGRSLPRDRNRRASGVRRPQRSMQDGTTAAPPDLWCRAAGSLALFRDRTERERLMGSGKPLALLVYLALSARRSASRDHLAELFWPGSRPDAARHSLRQVLYRLNHFARDGLLIRRRGVRLELQLGTTFDFLQAEEAIRTGAFEAATTLLRGRFLEDFSIPESREFERWAEAQRVRFDDAWEGAARQHARALADAGRPEEALHLAEELEERAPFGPQPIRLVMEFLAQTGRYQEAVSRFRVHAELLQGTLGEEPGQELSEFALAIQDRAERAAAYRSRRASPAQARRAASRAGRVCPPRHTTSTAAHLSE